MTFNGVRPVKGSNGSSSGYELNIQSNCKIISFHFKVSMVQQLTLHDVKFEIHTFSNTEIGPRRL